MQADLDGLDLLASRKIDHGNVPVMEKASFRSATIGVPSELS